jgi:hypothetical protein
MRYPTNHGKRGWVEVNPLYFTLMEKAIKGEVES